MLHLFNATKQTIVSKGYYMEISSDKNCVLSVMLFKAKIARWLGSFLVSPMQQIVLTSVRKSLRKSLTTSLWQNNEITTDEAFSENAYRGTLGNSY